MSALRDFTLPANNDFFLLFKKGGWLRIASIHTKNYNDYRLDIKTVLSDDPAIALERAAKNEGGISVKGLRELKKTMGFTQIRFKCNKGDKKVDIVTTNDSKGKAVVEFITSASKERPEACGSFHSYAGSELGKNCSNWGHSENEIADGKWGYNGNDEGVKRLYYLPAFVYNKYSFSMGGMLNIFFCDDWSSGDVPGTWRIFVR